MSGASSEPGVSGIKVEMHTPDNRPRSKEERPHPRHSDRGRAKNMENIGDSTRWRKGRSLPANVSVDPGRLPISASTPSPRSDWAWRERPPRHCSSP